MTHARKILCLSKINSYHRTSVTTQSEQGKLKKKKKDFKSIKLIYDLTVYVVVVVGVKIILKIWDFSPEEKCYSEGNFVIQYR